MGHPLHYALILLALALNWRDKAMLVLTAVVGASILAPVNAFTTADTFYVVCAVAEVIVALVALHLNTRASYFVSVMCAMLVVYHMLGWHYDGYPHDSPYRVLVKICEYAEILACALFSRPSLRLYKNATRLYR